MESRGRQARSIAHTSAQQQLEGLQTGGTVWKEIFSQQYGKFYFWLVGTSLVQWDAPRRGTILRYATNAGARHQVYWPHPTFAPWEWDPPEPQDEDDMQEWIQVTAVSSRSNSAISLAPVEVEDPFGDQHRVAMFLQHVRGNSPAIPADWGQPSNTQCPQTVSTNNLPNNDDDGDDEMSVESSAVSIQGYVPCLANQEEIAVVDLAAGITPRRKRRGWLKWGSIALGAGITALSVGRWLVGQRI